MKYVSFHATLDEPRDRYAELDRELVAHLRSPIVSRVKFVLAIESTRQVAVLLAPRDDERSVRVVVGEHIVRAPPECPGAKAHDGASAVRVTLEDANLFHVGDPLRVPLEVGDDGKTPFGCPGNSHPLGGAFHPRLLSSRSARRTSLPRQPGLV